MFRITRKLIGWTMVAGLVGTLFFGRDAYSYAKTAFGKARSAVAGEVPVEFEVDRARDMVQDLVHDARECMHVIAEQQVDVEHMQADIERREIALADQQEAIVARRAELASNESLFVHSGITYSQADIERDLTARFDRYKAARELLHRDQDLLAARKEALRANQEKLDHMLAAKLDLEVEIERLDARLETIAATESISELEIDDSRLNRAKSLIGDLNKQLDVRQRMLDAEGRFTGLIPVDLSGVPGDRNVANEIDDYFGEL